MSLLDTLASAASGQADKLDANAVASLLKGARTKARRLDPLAGDLADVAAHALRPVAGDLALLGRGLAAATLLRLATGDAAIVDAGRAALVAKISKASSFEEAAGLAVDALGRKVDAGMAAVAAREEAYDRVAAAAKVAGLKALRVLVPLVLAAL